MNYHNITTDDMRNGDGLRTVLWVAGCNHHSTMETYRKPVKYLTCPQCKNEIVLKAVR